MCNNSFSFSLLVCSSVKTRMQIQGGPKVGIQLLKYFLYALKLHAVYFMLLVK